jgi:ribosome-binding protein aMBF1 (putative translation factor)
MMTMGCKTIKPISQQLREAIDASGMSRYRICKEIALGESTMSHFMAGQCGLQLSTIDRLGKLLGLKVVAEERAAKIKGR